MKRLPVLFVVLFTVLFSYTVIAQEMGALRQAGSMNVPEKVQTPLGPPLAAGTYTIGTGGYFPTIDSAFNKLSIDGIAGEVILELVDYLYTAPVASSFTLNGPISGTGSTSRVTIKPVNNVASKIEGNGEAVFIFNNVSYLTIDGISLTGQTTLTIHALDNNQFGWNDCIDINKNSDHNIIQNINFISDDIDDNTIDIFLSATSGSTESPDSNIIQNNFIKKGAVGIIVSAYNAAPNTRVTGNIIRGNQVGSETDSLIGWGIQTEKSMSTIIEDNIVQNLTLNNSYDEYLCRGISSYWGDGDVIRNNVVHSIKSSGGYQGVGILLCGGLVSSHYGNDNLIYNNMVYDIQSTSSATNSSVAGIQMWYQNNPKIYYNTIYLSGNGSNQQGSASLYISHTCTNIEAKNNILVNTRDESPYFASAIYDYSSSNLTSDYNDFYVDSFEYSYLGYSDGFLYKTLPEWQAIGKDLHSITEMPHFAAPELHINSSLLTNIESHATPITGITSDFDGNLRNATTPDIGADEFNGTVIPVELISFTAIAYGKEAILNWSTATELNNNSFEVQRKAAESEFATIGIVKGQGTTTNQKEYSYTDKDLVDGKYFYRLKQIDYDGSYEYSNVIEVDVRLLDKFNLEQNYPNPFNPSTKISWQSPVSSWQTLKVYDVIGNEVATLVDEEMEAGYHTIDFNASELPSGVYFYKIAAGNFVKTKKMILLR
ncbi:MAG: hypothetical protein A2W30_09690 [Ignavibacteria bacterium RBG_16_36_9]|nr:MAG: hypothetical protein A2W30_09690 [Ignavibacteria bacterium RBG_16_36_9]